MDQQTPGNSFSTVFNPVDYPIVFGIDPGRLTPHSSWATHIPFAFLLIDLCRPASLVELGTLGGDSYCAFCQAIVQLKLSTRCTAIDTWAGDEHAGLYGPKVLAGLRAAHDPTYGHFSTLLQSTFDDALPRFEDGSIDVLHIDGLHTYEAVRHDYEAWLPKVNPQRGIILFHDTQARFPGFGVYRLWEEVSRNRPHFEFHHGWGLGVLAVGDDPPPAMLNFLRAANSHPQAARAFFEEVGMSIERLRVMRYTLWTMDRVLGQAEQHAQPLTAGDGAASGAAAQQPSKYREMLADPVGGARYFASRLKYLIEAWTAKTNA